MCGIAGIFHCGTIKPVDPLRVERMCDALVHRGPDDSGIWTAPGVGLGFRRLAIIDLAGSPQPMHSADGRAVLVFNGEIYNFRELRRELTELGATFRTDGDGEVILAAWQQWGAACLPRLHGMFAFAIYDTEARTLFLARDRLGVKPLFMAHLSDGSLVFASELKGLLAHPLLRREAVTSRMTADVPLGAFLSGGVDSSTVVALMAEASRNPVRTCTIGFDVEALDETSYAADVARLFGTDHEARVVGADQFDAVDTLASMFDEPFADASALPTWRVCQLARESVTVALSGDGADEAFAGYRRQVFHAHEERVRGTLPAGLRRNVLGSLGKLYPKAEWAPRPLRAKATLLALAGTGAEGYARALSVAPPELRGALYAPDLVRQLGDYRAEHPLIELMDNAPARSGLDRAQYADLKFWLPGDILTKVDRTSMAVSLEAREPLLDHRLVEFASTLPERMRVRGGQGKWLLKKAMRRYLPDSILYRPKQGFVTPIAQWLRGPLAGEARAIASSAALARTGWFDSAALAKLADAHVAGRADNSRLLWQLVMLDKSLVKLGIIS